MPHTVNYSGKRGLSNAKINQKIETIMIVSGKDLYLSLFTLALYSLPKDFPEAAKAAAVGYFTGI